MPAGLCGPFGSAWQEAERGEGQEGIQGSMAKGQQGAIPQHGACRGCQMHACGQEQPSKTRACSLFLKASRGRETEAGVMKHGMKEKKSHTLEAKCTGH